MVEDDDDAAVVDNSTGVVALTAVPLLLPPMSADAELDDDPRLADKSFSAAAVVVVVVLLTVVASEIGEFTLTELLLLLEEFNEWLDAMVDKVPLLLPDLVLLLGAVEVLLRLKISGPLLIKGDLLGNVVADVADDDVVVSVDKVG